MAVIAGQSRLQKFGSSANGSLTAITLIGPVVIPAATAGFGNVNVPYLSEFGASAAKGASSTLIQLQISNDGNSWTEIERIEIPDAGVVSIGYRVAIPICSGAQQFRVIGSQGTAARMAAKMFGYCTNADIVDL
jgi:hypothetical protein